MRITMIDLQCEDLMWFAVDPEGRIVALTSGGMGNVPEFVCADRDANDFLVEYFTKIQPEMTVEKLAVEYEENALIKDAIRLSRKGVFCFDANGDSYEKISSPEAPLVFDMLPDNIKSVMRSRIINCDVLTSDTIDVPHAY